MMENPETVQAIVDALHRVAVPLWFIVLGIFLKS
jgi:hypothetical protein